MTRLFNDNWQCPHCGVRHAKESLFSQWVRAHPELESGDGFTIHDADFWVHRYKVHQSSEVQCLMLVETKTFAASMSQSQRQTMSLVDQCMRNRRSQSVGRIQAGGVAIKFRDVLTKRVFACRLFGVHQLQFEKNGPQDSDWIRWDRRDVTEEQLIGLLRFDLDPDTLKPMDLRRHHRSVHRILPGMDGVEEASR